MAISDAFIKKYIGRLYMQIRNQQTPSLHHLFRCRDDSYTPIMKDPFAYKPTEAYEIQRIRHLQARYLGLIIKISAYIEMRDRYTAGHTKRLSRYAMAIGKTMGWRSERIEELELGAHLHDIGKICVAEDILNKQGRLTPREFRQVKRHVWMGATMLMRTDFLRPLIPFILYHHERYDGNGYPFKFKGKNIPIEGRIMAVIDTYDALISKRPYREALSKEEAMKEMDKERGLQLDPDIVDIFFETLNNGMSTA